MLRRLKTFRQAAARAIQTRRRRGNGTQPDLTLPMELICAIIDDYFSPICRHCDKKDLKSLALTCHALASYCRPMIWRFVRVSDVDFKWDKEGQTMFSKELRDKVTKLKSLQTSPSPQHWKMLCQYSCDIPDMVHTILLIPSQIRPRRETTLLQMLPGRRAKQNELDKRWLTVVNQPYRNISSLTLTITPRAWGDLPPKFSDAFLSLVKQPGVKMLDLWMEDFPPLSSTFLTQCLSMVDLRLTLKEFHHPIVPHHDGDFVALDGNHLPPNLEALTIEGRACQQLTQYLCGIPLSTNMHISKLKQLQLDDACSVSEISLIFSKNQIEFHSLVHLSLSPSKLTTPAGSTSLPPK